MKSNASEVTMSTAEFQLLAANLAHADCFSDIPPGKGALGHCSLPWLGLKDIHIMQRAHVGTLLYAIFLVVKPQCLLP